MQSIRCAAIYAPVPVPAPARAQPSSSGREEEAHAGSGLVEVEAVAHVDVEGIRLAPRARVAHGHQRHRGAAVTRDEVPAVPAEGIAAALGGVEAMDEAVHFTRSAAVEARRKEIT